MATRTADLVSEALNHGGPVDDATLKEIDALTRGAVTRETEKIMLGALSETNDPRLRNVLAVTLANINSDEAADRIEALINQSRTRGYRGSLLYALHKLRRPLPLLTLVHLILSDTAEVQEEAFEMLHDSAAHSARADLEAALLMLQHERLRANKPERAEIIDDARELLLPKPQKDGAADDKRSSGRN